MSLVSLLNQTVDVYRYQVTTGSKKQYTKQASIRVMIQPMSATASAASQLTFARAYEGYTERTSNILIGDYLQDTFGNKYDVQGIRDYNMGTQPFFQLSLQRQTQQGQS